MGRTARQIGNKTSVGGVTFEFAGNDGQGRDRWKCHRCENTIRLTPAETKHRRQSRVCLAHLALKTCSESGRQAHVEHRLVPTAGDAGLCIVATGVLACAVAIAAGLAFGGTFTRIALCSSDNREQCTVLLGNAGLLTSLASKIVDIANRCFPGWVIRGGEVFVMQWGSEQQPSHCDFHLDKGSDICRDSITVFVPLCDEREFGLQLPGGHMQPVRLCAGDVAVLGSNTFHSGLPHDKASRVLFFYMDRTTACETGRGRDRVGAKWCDLDPTAQSRYSVVTHHVHGERGFHAGFAKCWRTVNGGRGSKRKK
jgi:hypothetical protein